jgi:hypothetical protein
MRVKALKGLGRGRRLVNTSTTSRLAHSLTSLEPLSSVLSAPQTGTPHSRILMNILGLVATQSRAKIRARPRGHHAPDPTRRRQAQRRWTLHPRAVPFRIASPERGAHASVVERVQHARHAPSFARCIGRARRCDARPLRDDARFSRSRGCSLGYHARDDAARDG